MRFLLFFLALSSLFSTSSAAKSYWESALHDAYEYASKAPTDALKHIGKAVNPSKAFKSATGTFSDAADSVSKMGKNAAGYVTSFVQSPQAINGWNEARSHASSALSGAAETVGWFGQKASEQVSSFVQSPEVSKGWDAAKSHASSALSGAAETVGWLGQQASDHVTSFVQSPEASNGWDEVKSHASSAFAGASETVGWLGQQASEHVSSFVQSPTVNDGWTELKTRSAQAASAAYDGAATAVDSIRQTWNEVSEASPESNPKEETIKEYVQRVTGKIAEKAEEVKWGEYVAPVVRLFDYRSDESVKRTENFGLAAAINELAGAFKQINAYGEAIYKPVSRWSWGMRQINEVGTPIFKPSLFGSAFSGIGKLFWYGSVLAESVNVASAISQDMHDGTSTNTVHASSKAVASWTGAATGASAGATLFSFIPVVGPLAGGLIGGFAGAYSGSIVGEAAANAYDRAFKEHN